MKVKAPAEKNFRRASVKPVKKKGSGRQVSRRLILAGVLAVLVVNRLQAGFPVCAVKAPGFGDRRKAMLGDIATLCGGQFISEDLGIKLENVTIDMLGQAKQIVVEKESCTIISGAGKKDAIKKRIDQIRAQMDQTESEYDKEKFSERLAKMTGGVAIIRVGAATEADMKQKRSNEQYHRYLQAITSSRVTVQANAQGHALMSLDASVAPGDFTAHFPYDAPVKWLGNGQVKVAADQLVPASSFLASVQVVTNRYDQDCPGCGPGKGQTNLNFVPTANQLNFTVDGGLEGAGLLATPRPLNWGWIAAPSIQKYAQRTTTWTAGNFLMAGCFLRGDQTAFPPDDRAGVLLLTGAMPNDLTQLERPGTAAYANGYADYPGLNFRVGTNGVIKGESVLAGVATGLYDLTGRSK